MQLLIATTSPDKLAEIRAVLTDAPVDLLTLSDVPPIAAPNETGATFADNARLKAVYYAEHTGLHVAADDSGLAIDALDGAPGVLSARYNGSTYPERFANIYRELAQRGAATSPARYVCAVALAAPGRLLFEAEGTVDGSIAPEPRGTGGFGYDPIFFYAPCGRTFAEITAAEKLAVNHRRRAFEALAAFLTRVKGQP
jgi:XTP/dITP diphosphohydrolase